MRTEVTSPRPSRSPTLPVAPASDTSIAPVQGMHKAAPEDEAEVLTRAVVAPAWRAVGCRRRLRCSALDRHPGGIALDRQMVGEEVADPAARSRRPWVEHERAVEVAEVGKSPSSIVPACCPAACETTATVATSAKQRAHMPPRDPRMLRARNGTTVHQYWRRTRIEAMGATAIAIAILGHVSPQSLSLRLTLAITARSRPIPRTSCGCSG